MIKSVVECAVLKSVDISAAVGAPTHITAATVVEEKPADYCKVEGYAEMLNWFGSGFYSAGYEMWCTGNGASFNCKNSK